MDQLALPPEYMKAGQDYDDALKSFGLRPEGLLWAWDKTMLEFVLVLVTEQIDHVGSGELYRLLTLAYNHSATPAVISPFIIRLHSPKQLIVGEFLKVVRIGRPPADMTMMSRGGVFTLQEFYADVDDLQFKFEWIYYLHQPAIAADTRRRQWRRFRSEVEALVA